MDSTPVHVPVKQCYYALGDAMGQGSTEFWISHREWDISGSQVGTFSIFQLLKGGLANVQQSQIVDLSSGNWEGRVRLHWADINLTLLSFHRHLRLQTTRWDHRCQSVLLLLDATITFFRLQISAVLEVHHDNIFCNISKANSCWLKQMLFKPGTDMCELKIDYQNHFNCTDTLRSA